MFGSELTMLIILGKHYKTLEADAVALVRCACVSVGAALVCVCISGRRAGSIGQNGNRITPLDLTKPVLIILNFMHRCRGYLFDYLNWLSAGSISFASSECMNFIQKQMVLRFILNYICCILYFLAAGLFLNMNIK